MTNTPIEKNIPIPDNGNRGRKSKYEFEQFTEVGDSKFFHVDAIRLRAAASMFKRKRQPTWSFTVVEQPGGCRIWRTK